MASGRLGVVWNPLRAEQATLETALANAGFTGEVGWYASSAEDAGQAACSKAIDDGSEAVIVAGGDGTVRAVAETLAGTGIPMGIVPIGTGNLLARNLGIPLNDVERGFRTALHDPTRSIDVGWADLTGGDQPGRHVFVVMAGFGIDSRMIAETDEELKVKAGWIAYVAALGKALATVRVTGMWLSVDDAERRRARAHTLLIGNCGTVRGGITLLPDAVIDDGLLDILLASAVTLPQWIDTLKTMVWDNGVLRLFRRRRRARDGNATTHFSASTIRVEVANPVTFQVDGDTLGDITAVTVEVAPGALLVRAPDVSR